MSSTALDKKLEALLKRDIKELLSNATESAAFIAYYYPQYTFEQAGDLPEGDVKQLIKFAMKQEVSGRIHSLQIAAAARSAEAYKKLSTKYTRQLEKIK